MTPPADRHLREAGTRATLLFRMCGRLRREDCLMCPEEVETAYGRGSPLCRGLAQEAVAMVMEDVAERRGDVITQDN